MIATLIALALYALGVVLMREYTDCLQEEEQVYLPTGEYWRFILTWPYQIVMGLFQGDYKDE